LTATTTHFRSTTNNCQGALINFTKRRAIILALLTITGLAAGYIGFNLVLDALLGGRFLW
jgi:hypothetical protein